MAQGRRFVDLAWELPSQRMESLGGDVMAEALEQRGDRCFGLPWELPSQLGRCRSLGSCQVSAWNRCEVVFWQRLWSKGVKICWSRWGAAKSAHGIVGRCRYGRGSGAKGRRCVGLAWELPNKSCNAIHEARAHNLWDNTAKAMQCNHN